MRTGVGSTPRARAATGSRGGNGRSIVVRPTDIERGTFAGSGGAGAGGDAREGRLSILPSRGSASAGATSAEGGALFATDNADGPWVREVGINASRGDAPDGSEPVSKRDRARGRVVGSVA